MAYARKIDGSWVELVGSFVIGDLQYPAGWPAAATTEEREALGICEIAEPGEQPEHVQVIGSSITGDTEAERIWVTEDYPLDELKAQRKAAAEAHRDQRLNGGCDTPHGRIDTDQVSRANINGSVSMASILGQAFTARWRRSDNSYVELNAPAMIAIGLAAGQFVAACYEASFATKDAIDAAASTEAVLSVPINENYPA